MAKKNLNSAAMDIAGNMINKAKAQEEKEKKPDKAPFTIWTDPGLIQQWKNYQKAKKDVLPTQAAFVATALNDYMEKHPVTDEEKEARKEELEKLLLNF